MIYEELISMKNAYEEARDQYCNDLMTEINSLFDKLIELKGPIPIVDSEGTAIGLTPDFEIDVVYDDN